MFYILLVWRWREEQTRYMYNMGSGRRYVFLCEEEGGLLRTWAGYGGRRVGSCVLVTGARCLPLFSLHHSLSLSPLTLCLSYTLYFSAYICHIYTHNI